MQPHAPLFALVALLALAHARAASIQQISPELEKKLAEVVEEAIKEQKPIEADIPPVPVENLSSEPALLEQANLVKDVENNLRKVPAPEIPVKVIVEDSQSTLKSDVEPVKKEVVSESVDVKRAEPDLNNPGAPQHQEHDNQGANHFEQNDILSNIKTAIAETQTIFNQGFYDVTKNVQSFFLKNEQLSSIQENIQDFQNKFRSQVDKINESLKTFIAPVNGNPIEPADKETQLKKEIISVQSTIKSLEKNFEKGINTISNGVEVFASGKEESANEVKPSQPAQPQPSPAVPPPAALPSNPLSDILNTWGNNIAANFGNISSTISNYLTPGNQQQNTGTNESPQGGFLAGLFNPAPPKPAEGAQADEHLATNRPSLLQTFQQGFQNLLNPNQVQADPQQPAPIQPNRPFLNLQNNIVQGFNNLFQSNRQPAPSPMKPAEPTKPMNSAEPAKPEQQSNDLKPEAMPQGSNVVPVVEAQKPIKQEAPGPIQQIGQQIQKNPIVRGISGAVQRLQNTITNNPDQPRDVMGEEKADKKQEQNEAFAAKGHKPGSGSSDDDGNSDSKRIVEETKPVSDIKSVADVQNIAVAEPQKVENLDKPQDVEVPSSQVIKTE